MSDAAAVSREPTPAALDAPHPHRAGEGVGGNGRGFHTLGRLLKAMPVAGGARFLRNGVMTPGQILAYGLALVLYWSGR